MQDTKLDMGTDSLQLNLSISSNSIAEMVYRTLGTLVNPQEFPSGETNNQYPHLNLRTPRFGLEYPVNVGSTLVRLLSSSFLPCVTDKCWPLHRS